MVIVLGFIWLGKGGCLIKVKVVCCLGKGCCSIEVKVMCYRSKCGCYEGSGGCIIKVNVLVLSMKW